MQFIGLSIASITERVKKNWESFMIRSRTKNIEQNSIEINDHFNIIDILLLDHKYLKDCVEILKDEEGDKRKKMKCSKGFLDALKKHSAGEKKAMYTPLKKVKDFHIHILESEIEHAIVDSKVKLLSSKISRSKSLSDELAAELKVLADLVEHHLEEEEDILFPKMKKEIDEEILNQMGYQFMVIRKFNEKDLEDSDLLEEMPNISQSALPFRQFMNSTQQYFASHR